jgi:hypothetical protein
MVIGANTMTKSAVISGCSKYRYSLTRTWGIDETNYCVFIGLNPSTADAENDDPTIRRCIVFAKDLGFDSLSMLNLFAYRATNPKDMMGADDPIGPDNDTWLRDVCRHSKMTIAAWGNHGAFKVRSSQVRQKFTHGLYVFGLTKSGEPLHPLYLKKDLRPFRWIGEQIG